MKQVLAGLMFIALSIPAISHAKTLQEHAEEQAALVIAKDMCPLTYDEKKNGAFIAATVPRDQLQAFFQTITKTVFNTGFDVERSPADFKQHYCAQAKAYVQINGLAN